MAYQQAPPPDLPREALVKYLARYVSGVAISDQRLVSCEHGQVTYTVKNRKEHGRCEERTIGVSDFLSRYMQHVLPPGFTRVRSYGFLSSGNAKRREHCRELLEAIASSTPASVAACEPACEPASAVSCADLSPPSSAPAAISSAAISPAARASRRLCAICQQGALRVVEAWPIPKWVVRWAKLYRPRSAPGPTASSSSMSSGVTAPEIKDSS